MSESAKCPYCGKQATCEDSKVIYGRSFGFVWICRCKPAMSYVGCHGGTKVALGTLADEPTREARKKAHRKFDPLWKEGGMTRRNAYAWLADALGVVVEDAHIATSTEEQCKRILRACKARNRAIRA